MRSIELILGFLISALLGCHGLSRTVFQLVKHLQNQSEIIFISDTFPDTIPVYSQHLSQSSFIHFREGGQLDENFFTKLTRNYSHSVKIIVSLPKIPEMISVVSQFGKSDILKGHPALWSLYVLWPLELIDELEMNRTLEANFKSPNISKDFSVNRDLFVVFTSPSGMAVRSAVQGQSEYVETVRQFTFYELYSVNQTFIYRRIEMIGPRCPNCSSKTARRMDFKGLVLRFEGVQDKDYNDDTLFVERNDSIAEFNKSFSVNVVELLREALNFTVKPIRSEQWGKLLPNKTSIGVIEDIRNGMADVGISTSVMLPYRAELVSFLPATDEYVVAAFFHPPSLNAIRDIFMQPFKADLWAAVLATWLILASSMILFTFIRKKVGAHDNKNDPSATEPDFTQDSMIWALATACQQGWDEHPSALSLRAIFISGSFTAVIAYAGYSAAIVSTLSVRIDPIQSPAALIKSNLRIGMRDGFFQDIIPKYKDKKDIVSDLYDRLSSREGERIVNISTGVNLLKKYPYAFISVKEAFYDILKVSDSPTADLDICGIKELRILKQGFKAGMFTHKLFPFREYFRLMLILIRERGILWRLRNDFTYSRRCLETSDNAGRALGANDVFTAFMILCGGYILSTFFLIIEKLICLYKYNYAYPITP